MSCQRAVIVQMSLQSDAMLVGCSIQLALQGIAPGHMVQPLVTATPRRDDAAVHFGEGRGKRPS